MTGSSKIVTSFKITFQTYPFKFSAKNLFLEFLCSWQKETVLRAKFSLSFNAATTPPFFAKETIQMFWKPKLRGTGYSCFLSLFLSLSYLPWDIIRQLRKTQITVLFYLQLDLALQFPLGYPRHRELIWEKLTLVQKRSGSSPGWQTQLRPLLHGQVGSGFSISITLLLQYFFKTQYSLAHMSNRFNLLFYSQIVGCFVTQSSAWRNFRNPKGLNHYRLPKLSIGH